MKLPLEKVKAMVLYFAEHTEPRFLGKTKLMKLFYFADFGYVKKHGVPMTFDKYKNMEHGPVPTTIYGLVSSTYSEPDESLLSDIIEFKELSGIHKIVPTQEFTSTHRKLFSIAELKMLGEVCQRFNTSNAREIEEASHKENPWSSTELLDDIPYNLATKDKDSETSKDEVDLAMQILK
jgi:uncharacterized phage-associated protein